MIKFKIWQYDAIFDENKKILEVNWRIYRPSVRKLFEMRDLYLNSDNLPDDVDLYFMFRGVYWSNEDKKVFEKYNLRYDITVILPKVIWIEYLKTFWHYHPKNKIWRFYEEIYEVLVWKAIYLQQSDYSTIYTYAEKWDVVLMKEGFWHITINPAKDQILIMANIVSSKFSSMYDKIKSKKWGRYYFTIDWWIKNENYKDDIPLIKTDDTKLNFTDLYQTFVKSPDDFRFLN